MLSPNTTPKRIRSPTAARPIDLDLTTPQPNPPQNQSAEGAPYPSLGRSPRYPTPQTQGLKARHINLKPAPHRDDLPNHSHFRRCPFHCPCPCLCPCPRPRTSPLPLPLTSPSPLSSCRCPRPWGRSGFQPGHLNPPQKRALAPGVCPRPTQHQNLSGRQPPPVPSISTSRPRNPTHHKPKR